MLSLVGAGVAYSALTGCSTPAPATPAARGQLADPLTYSSTEALAAAIRTKRVSSEEVVKAHLQRIEAVNAKLNAVVQMAAERALEEAREADAVLAKGELKGPLHGVPMTIKDSFDTKGVISTGGTKGRAAFVPKKDATVVARLREAGAILLGKTNTPELTLSFETNNLIYGRTNNPYDVNRSSGGSSGGAAAIIAAGGAPFDIGSDFGGSIRLPANWNGIAGIKPSSGRVPRTGHIYPFGGMLDSLQQVGPLARYVDDLALILSIIAGPDWIDPAVIEMPFGDPKDVDLGKLRVSFHTDNGIATPTPEIIKVVRSAAKAFSDGQIAVDEVRPPGLEQGYDLLDLYFAELRVAVARLLKMYGTTEHTLEGFLVAPAPIGRRARCLGHPLVRLSEPLDYLSRGLRCDRMSGEFRCRTHSRSLGRQRVFARFQLYVHLQPDRMAGHGAARRNISRGDAHRHPGPRSPGTRGCHPRRGKISGDRPGRVSTTEHLIPFFPPLGDGHTETSSYLGRSVCAGRVDLARNFRLSIEEGRATGLHLGVAQLNRRLLQRRSKG